MKNKRTATGAPPLKIPGGGQPHFPSFHFINPICAKLPFHTTAAEYIAIEAEVATAGTSTAVAADVIRAGPFSGYLPSVAASSG
jgi:hypothetical protein